MATKKTTKKAAPKKTVPKKRATAKRRARAPEPRVLVMDARMLTATLLDRATYCTCGSEECKTVSEATTILLQGLVQAEMPAAISILVVARLSGILVASAREEERDQFREVFSNMASGTEESALNVLRAKCPPPTPTVNTPAPKGVN